MSGCGEKVGEWSGLNEKIFGDFAIEESVGAFTTASAPATKVVFTCAPRPVQAGSEWKWNATGCVTADGAPGGIRVEIRNSKGARVLGAYSATDSSLDDSAKAVTLSLLSGTGQLLGTTTLEATAGAVDFSGAELGMTTAGVKRIRASMTNSAGKVLGRDSSNFTVLPRDQIDTQNGIELRDV